MEKSTKQTQNPGKTSMLSPKGMLEALGLGMILNLFSPQPGEEKTSLLSPEAVAMLSLGLILDFLSIICAILILALGVGLILSKIVYFIGFIIVSIWSILRGGGIQRGEKQVGKQVSKGLGKFLKKYGKNLAVKAVPAIGDVLPLWTLTIFLELKS